MKYLVFPVVASAVLFTTGCKSVEKGSDVLEITDISVEETILQEHIEARGGAKVLSGISTTKTTGEVFMPAMDITMLLTIFQKSPDKLRVEIDVPQMGAKILSGYDGETAWESNPMTGGAAKLGGERARSLREQADMDGYLIGATQWGYDVGYIGDEDVKGSVNHKFRVLRPDSSEVYVYLDVATKLETKIQAEAPNPMTGAPSKVETFMSDHREVGGTRMPFKMEVVVEGEPFQTVTIKDIQVNVPVDDSIFGFPE